MGTLNVMRAIESVDVNIRYDATHSGLKEIAEQSSGVLDTLYSAFKYGYTQGVKAEKARVEQERKNA